MENKEKEEVELTEVKSDDAQATASTSSDKPERKEKGKKKKKAKAVKIKTDHDSSASTSDDEPSVNCHNSQFALLLCFFAEINEAQKEVRERGRGRKQGINCKYWKLWLAFTVAVHMQACCIFLWGDPAFLSIDVCL